MTRDDLPETRFDSRLAQRQSTLSLQRRVVDQEVGHLAPSLASVVDDGSLVTAAGMLVASRRRFVTGAGKSSGYAALLAADLAVALSHVALVGRAGSPALDVLPEVRTSDVLVAFSFRRYRRETVHVAEEFVAAGGELIGFTDSHDAPLAKTATQLIVVDTASASYADSPTAVVAAAHVLATLAAASAKGARRRVASRSRLSETMGLYVDRPDLNPDPTERAD